MNVPKNQSDSIRVAANAGWAFCGFAWPTIMLLVGTPIYLHFLGVKGYGLWTIANTLLGLLGVVNLGLGDATTKYVAEYSAKGEPENLTRVVYATFVLFFLIGIAGTVILLLSSPFLAHTIFKLKGEEASTAVAVFQIASIGLMPSVSLTSVLGIFDGLQKYKVSQLLLMLRATSVVLVGGLFLLWGYGLKGLMTVNISVIWFVWLLGIFLGLQTIPRLALRKGQFSIYMKRVFSFSINSTLITIGSMAHAQLGRVVIGSFLGLDAVSYYTVTQTVASRINALCASTTRVLMPFFSAREASSGAAGLAGPLLISWRISLMLALAIIAAAAACAPWLLRVWLGSTFSSQALLLYIIFLGVYSLNTVNIIPYYYLLGRGKPFEIAKNTLVASLVVLAGICAAAVSIGIVGVVIAEVLYPIIMLRLGTLSLRITEGQVTWRRLLAGIWLPLILHLAAVLCGLLIGYCLDRTLHSSLLSFFMSLSTAACLVGGGYIILRKSKNQFYQDSWSMISRIFLHLRGKSWFPLSKQS